MNKPDNAPLTAKDFASDQEVRWCPGCGDYSILKAVQKTLADIQASPENTVFISGIGCAARLPYYINSYGFHTIHGRAAAIASGVKLANAALNVWVVSGDGDSLAIGGNHLMHLLRRNINLQYLLINNQIYGLTKGQASPSSSRSLRTPSSPMGTLDSPLNACAFALGSGGKFIARCGDIMQKHMNEVLRRAYEYRGTGFVEILQNCLVYNDGAFAHILDKEVQGEAQLLLRHGEKMVFGSESNKGLVFNSKTFALEVVEFSGDVPESVLVHDEGNEFLANLLVRLESPFALGVIYAVSGAPSFDSLFAEYGSNNKRNEAELEKLLDSGTRWDI